MEGRRNGHPFRLVRTLLCTLFLSNYNPCRSARWSHHKVLPWSFSFLPKPEAGPLCATTPGLAPESSHTLCSDLRLRLLSRLTLFLPHRIQILPFCFSTSTRNHARPALCLLQNVAKLWHALWNILRNTTGNRKMTWMYWNWPNESMGRVAKACSAWSRSSGASKDLPLVQPINP